MNNDKTFESKLKDILDKSELSLDTDTRKRLLSIRNQALNSRAPNFVPSKWLAISNWKHNPWLPATSLAFCALIAMFIVINPKVQTPSINQQDQVAILEILNDPDDLETISDPDFYLWADEVLAETASGHAT